MNSPHKNKIITVVCLIIIVAVVALIFPKKSDRTPTTLPQFSESSLTPTLPEKSPSSVSPEYFDFKLANFQIQKLVGWDIVPPESVRLPKGLDGTQFAFRKQGTSCILAYLFSTKFYPDYKQTLVGDRIFTVDNEQLDFWWYTHKDYLPEGYFIGFKTGEHRPHEVEMQDYPIFTGGWRPDTTELLVLFNEDGKVVDDECSKEAATMFASIHERYDTIPLSNNSQGTLFFGDDVNRKFHLFLVPSGDQITHSVTDFDIDSDPQPSVYRNVVYFTAKGKLKILDPFTQTITNVSNITQAENEVVNEFYVHNDDLYYLLGKSCNEYRFKCDNKLYKYNFLTHANKLLAEHSISRTIIGYDAQRNILSMMYADGDAGCYWASLEEYGFQTNSLVSKGSYSSCDGDPDFKDKMKQYDAIFAPFAGQATTTSYILIDKGKILPPKGWIPLRASPVELKYMY